MPQTDRPLLYMVQNAHPRFWVAIAADARMAARQRGDRRVPANRWQLVAQVLHLMWATDAFGALVLYRIRTSAQRRGIPVIPRLCHRLCILWAGVTIGDPCLLHPGVLLNHGQVVIDGFTVIGSGTRIRPYVSIGLLDGGLRGPAIGEGVRIGVGSTILGDISIGDGAAIGANSFVMKDVPPGVTVVGTPARPVGGPAEG